MAATFDPQNNLGFDLSGGDLVASGSTPYALVVKGTDPKVSGKYYIEFTINDIGGGFVLDTNSSTFSGATLPFSSTTGVADTAPVKGTNIANGSEVLSFLPNISVTLTENITGTVGIGEPITFGSVGCSTFPVPNPGLGIAMLGADFNAMASSGLYAAILYANGNAIVNKVSIPIVSAPWVTGDLIGVAIDLDDGTIWFRRNASNWNNSIASNPATDTGGISISTLFKSIVFTVINNSCNAAFSITIATDPIDFIYSAPIGFTQGWPDNAYIDLGITKLTALAPISPPDLAIRKITAQAPLGPPNEAIRKLTGEALIGPPNLAIRKLTNEVILGPPNLAIRKLTAYVFFQPAVPVPGPGPIPLFPDLPQGFPIRLSIVMDTIIGTVKSLREVRVAQQQYPLWDIEIPFQELRDETQNQVPYEPFVYPTTFQEFEELCQLWLMMYGQTNVFAFDAPWDNSRSEQFIGTGDGITYSFTALRTWGSGTLASLLPVGMINDIMEVKVNNVVISSAYYKADRNKLVFQDVSGNTYPPGSGLAITMTFSFYYLCRFVADEQDFEEFSKNRWTVPSLKFRAVDWP